MAAFEERQMITIRMVGSFREWNPHHQIQLLWVFERVSSSVQLEEIYFPHLLHLRFEARTSKERPRFQNLET